MSSLAFFGSSMGAGEILLILGVVLLFFGADRLPSLARSLGKSLEEFRRAARDLRRGILEEPPRAARHAPPEPNSPSGERPG